MLVEEGRRLLAVIPIYNLIINSAGVFLMLVLLFKKFEASVGESW